MENYTVIGYYEDNGQIFCHHVEAMSPPHAFQRCTVEMDLDGNALFVAVIHGVVSEDDGVDFPGEGVVDAETVLDQPDVFGGDA